MQRLFLITFLVCLAFSQVSAQNPVLDAAGYLPKDTIFTIALGSPEGFLNKAGWEKLPKQYMDLYQQGIEEVKKEIGYDLLTPDGLRNVGVDPAAPAGFAFLDAKKETVAFFVSVADAGQLQTALYDIAAKHKQGMKSDLVGDVSIVYSDEKNPDVFFVFRGGYMFILGGGWKFRENGLQSATEFAGIGKSESLAGDPGFKKSMRALGFGRDLAGYFSTSALINEYMAHMEKQLKEPVKDDWEKRYRKRKEAEYEMLQTYFAPITGVAFGVELQGSSIQVKCHMAMKPGSAAARLLVNSEGIPFIYNLLKTPPLFAAYGTVDPETVMDFIMMAVAAEEGPEDIEEGRKAIKKELGFDILKLHKLFSGEVGMAITGELEFSDNPEAVVNQIGGVAFARVTNPEMVKDLLNRIATHPEIRKEANLGVDMALDALIIPTPDWKDIYVAVVDDYLVVSVGKEFCQHFSQAGTGSFVEQYDNGQLRGFLNTPNPSALSILDLELAAAFAILENAASHYSSDYEDKYGRINAGKGFRKKLDELIELDKKLQVIMKKKSQRENEIMLRIVKRFGISAAMVKIESDGLSISFGQFMSRNNLATIIADTAGDIMAQEQMSSEFYNQKWQLQDKVWKLERELDEMRWSKDDK